MTKKKTTPKKVAGEKSILNKIGGEVKHLADEIIVGKDHLIEMAGNAIDSVKETIHNITTKKKAPKKAVKAIANKTATKLSNPVNKKLASSNAIGKTAIAKKSNKKVIKKISGKNKK